MFLSVGSFAARRHRLVLATVGVLFLIVTVIGIGAFASLQDGGQTDPNAPSSQAESLLSSHFGGEQQLVILVTGRQASVDAPAVAAVGRTITTRLLNDPQISHVTSYWQSPTSALRSIDGRSALVLAHVQGSAKQADDRTTALVPNLAALGGTVASVQAGGSAAAGTQIGTQIGKDLLLVSVVAVPITIILLYLVFASLAAALLPLAVAVLAIMGTFAELHVLTLFTSVSTYAIDLTIALGLGLSVDYSLLLINRYREELARGAEPYHAIERAVATAGRTIVFSALTVAVSLTALLVFPLYFLRSFAYAGIAVVAFAVLGALLLMPALLAAFGTRVASRRAPATATAESPMWRRLATAVTARPLRVALPVVAVLVVVGSPFLHVHFATADDRVLPATASAHQVGDALRNRFAADAASTLDVVATGTANGSEEATYAQELSALPGVSNVEGPTGTFAGSHQVGPPTSSYVSGRVTYWSIRNHLPSTSGAAQTLVHQVRAVPAPAGQTVRVGGPAADLVDQKHSIGSSLPLAGAIIVLATFIVLFLFTGSVLIPLKALILNALALFAVIGFMVWIFQGGHLTGLLGFTPTATSTTIPPLLFVIAFGLSMDYEVFLLSRIKELHEQGTANTEAVIGGLARTGRIVSTAAALLAVTFFAFGLSKISFIQLFGIGTGIAILLDATIVRGLLVPAIMRLVGEPIWWAPSALRRLHGRVGLGEHDAPVSQ
ncbi:MAG: MMPL family transporter [Actinomycetota bacterium]|nr:MMPL family transporter [Actinomycetota bacterium]